MILVTLSIVMKHVSLLYALITRHKEYKLVMMAILSMVMDAVQHVRYKHFISVIMMLLQVFAIMIIDLTLRYHRLLMTAIKSRLNSEFILIMVIMIQLNLIIFSIKMICFILPFNHIVVKEILYHILISIQTHYKEWWHCSNSIQLRWILHKLLHILLLNRLSKLMRLTISRLFTIAKTNASKNNRFKNLLMLYNMLLTESCLLQQSQPR